MYDINEMFLFSGLGNDALKDATSNIKTSCFERGEIIYDKTDFRRAIGVFLSGKGYAGDKNTHKAEFTPGDVFGAAALFGAGECYVSRITAARDSEVAFIYEDEILALMKKYPVCAVNYITFLSDKIRYLNRKIAQYTGPGAAARLYRLLCDEADDEGKIIDINMSALASLAGMGRTSVYRALDELIRDGSVEKSGKTLTIRS